MVSQGVDVRAHNNIAVRWTSMHGHLEVVKHLVSQGADVRSLDDIAVQFASMNGHLEVVKYLVSQGADIRANNDWAVRRASNNGHLVVVKYLVSQGATTTDISDKVHHYISFCEKMEKKRKTGHKRKYIFGGFPFAMM